MDKYLHIVCFDVPYPPNYGGVIDVFYKIKALHEEGIKIYLHCFEYGRGKSEEINRYCEEVIYYKRNTGLRGFSFHLPYIVISRQNKKLLQNLVKDEHPVLLEGIHSTYFLFKNKLSNKKVFVRLHNTEYKYYHQLSKYRTSFLRGIYYLFESTLLKRYEKAVASKAVLLSISEKDIKTFETEFNSNKIYYLPAFISCSSIESKIGKGDYCLYHGNLSINENEEAAASLIKIFLKLPNIKLVIAGRNPSGQLKQQISRQTNISLIATPSQKEMNELIKNAQINILPSFVSAGVKIKILNALCLGRHCIIDNTSVIDKDVLQHCHIAENADQTKTLTTELFNREFTKEDIENRRKILELYGNKTNAQKLIQLIW